MAIAAYYKAEMSAALPGQVSDTSRYNVDGACVVDNAQPETPAKDVKVGYAVRVVHVDNDGVKQIQQIAQISEVPYGVAIRSHFQAEADDGSMVYKANGGINVITVGRVWMVYGESGDTAPGFGGHVKIDAQGRAVKDSGSGATTGWSYTGAMTTFDGVKLVEVQLHQI